MELLDPAYSFLQLAGLCFCAEFGCWAGSGLRSRLATVSFRVVRYAAAILDPEGHLPAGAAGRTHNEVAPHGAAYFEHARLIGHAHAPGEYSAEPYALEPENRAEIESSFSILSGRSRQKRRRIRTTGAPLGVRRATGMCGGAKMRSLKVSGLGFTMLLASAWVADSQAQQAAPAGGAPTQTASPRVNSPEILSDNRVEFPAARS